VTGCDLPNPDTAGLAERSTGVAGDCGIDEGGGGGRLVFKLAAPTFLICAWI